MAANPGARAIGFRARTVDVNVRLGLLRSADELSEEAAVSRVAAHSHVALDRENEEVLTVKAREPKQGKMEEIPTPEVFVVASYETDYRPIFRLPPTYLRTPTNQEGEFVEYDLDNDDEDWLAEFNAGQERLQPEMFEVMLWKLELACSEAQTRSLADMHAVAAERSLPPPSYADKVALAANTEVFPRDAAYEVLNSVTKRVPAVVAVYEYWLKKRQRLNKPILRRLQVPPAVSDQNYNNVFRPREKVHRPQTRRRRENDSGAFTRMRNLKANLDMGRAILEWLSRREKRKRDILQCEMDMQVLQLRLRHDSKQSLEAAAVADGDGHKAKGEAGPSAHHGQAEAIGPNGQLLQSHASKDRNKRRREATQNRKPAGGGAGGGGAEVELYQPAPPPPEVQLLFLEPRLQAPGFQMPAAACGMKGRARVGRGGRLIFDRVDPIMREPFAEPMKFAPTRVLAVEPSAMDVS